MSTDGSDVGSFATDDQKIGSCQMFSIAAIMAKTKASDPPKVDSDVGLQLLDKNRKPKKHRITSNDDLVNSKRRKLSQVSGSLKVGDEFKLDESMSEHTCLELEDVECRLESEDLWNKFHTLGTEMIITKTGRRMFPTIRCTFSRNSFKTLMSSQGFVILLDIVPCDNKRYRYAYHRSSWLVAGKADPPPPQRVYIHPDGPFTEEQLFSGHQVISFERVKLTNNESDKTGQIILNSMHKFQPRIHLVMVSPENPFDASNWRSYKHKSFVFNETVFTAVTAYQNQLITKLKIDSNPFAKGFRDSSRICEMERDQMSSIFENRCNYNQNPGYSKSKLQSPTPQTMKTPFCKQESDDSTKASNNDGNNMKCVKEDWNIFAAAQALSAARAQLFNQTHRPPPVPPLSLLPPVSPLGLDQKFSPGAMQAPQGIGLQQFLPTLSQNFSLPAAALFANHLNQSELAKSNNSQTSLIPWILLHQQLMASSAMANLSRICSIQAQMPTEKLPQDDEAVNSNSEDSDVESDVENVGILHSNGCE